jgi:phosphoribosylaminoimidazolecarboxamide formyltransferase/IMP cyclohydrolase
MKQMDVKIKRALVSVSDKAGVVEFAKQLAEWGVKIISTGGTAKALAAAGIGVTAVDVVTGFPEMMDGRVKTLHPKIHGALLGIRDNADHAAAMKTHGIEPIDMVCINLYPFEQTVAKPGCTFEDAIENIDIGGPSMVRSAAKNHKYVTVVTDPGQYRAVLDEMRANNGAVTEATRSNFARIAFGLTASYDAAISKYLNLKAGITFPERASIAARKDMELRYGENPHQAGAFYKLPGATEPSVGSAKLMPGGKEISFNNIMDANAAFELIKEFDEPAVVIVKHMNPCGVAIDPDIHIAYQKAYETDVVSAFGGIIAVNRKVDKAFATTVMESFARFGKAKGAAGFFAEVIVAPGFDDDAVNAIRTLKTWGGDVRLLATGEIDRSRIDKNELDIRCVVGGLLLQQRDLIAWEPDSLTYPTKKKPTPEQLEDLRIAWITAKHVKSNTIVLAKNRKVIGVGAGQMNRVESGKLAVQMAGAESKGSVMASDAFFPFPDNVVNAAAAGVVCVIQPGGSKKDADVIAAADHAGMAMVLTGKRHFKH